MFFSASFSSFHSLSFSLFSNLSKPTSRPKKTTKSDGMVWTGEEREQEKEKEKEKRSKREQEEIQPPAALCYFKSPLFLSYFIFLFSSCFLCLFPFLSYPYRPCPVHRSSRFLFPSFGYWPGFWFLLSPFINLQNP